jgi:RNA ligase (TIGR02306 family)
MRKLATIRKISNIISIPDADKICTYVVDGWTIVDNVGKYQIDELVIMIEIDSWIPTELAPFLSKGKEPREYNGVKGEKLRTIRLRKQLSQGLILPLKVLIKSHGKDSFSSTVPYVEDNDVTEFLGIQKWEAPINAQLAGLVRGNFPSLVPKTDQERIQNLKNELDQWTNNENFTWEISEKLEGSSCTMYIDDEGEFHVCSRNLDLKKDENNSFWKVAIDNKIEQKMKDAGLMGYALQGELVGAGIQGNIYEMQDQRFYVYDIYDTHKGEFIKPLYVRVLCQEMGINHVPIMDVAFVIDKTMSQMLDFADGQSVMGLIGCLREGLVFKCNEYGGPSFKVISNKYLLGVKD